MNNNQSNDIPEVFREALEGGSLLEEHDYEKCGALICERCEHPVTVAAFNYYGPPSEPMMETIGECCFEERDDAMNIIINWKAGPREANYRQNHCDDPWALHPQNSL